MIRSEDLAAKRKMILQELDKGHIPSILELGMYDLTPYFVDNFNVSLSEAIMLNQNLERGVKHLNEKIYFSPPQQEALDFLFKKDKVILSAPTSFGKTLIVKEFIFRNQPQSVVYIVPTNALAYELEKSFKTNENFKEYTIFDRSENKKNIDSKNIASAKLLFIGTQEKFLEVDSNNSQKIDLFVIDEAYKLEESTQNQRGYKLSETFLQSINYKSKKIILITPQAKFKGFNNFNFSLFESSFNSVEKNFIVLNSGALYEKFLEIGSQEKSILFCKSPGQINETYDYLNNKLHDTEYNNAFIEQLALDVHPEWSVVKLLKKGVLTHHGQMPKYVQNKMINLFNSDYNYKQLLGTNSISEGINTSTKNLFIHPEYGDVNNNLLLIKNTIGRAGRLGEYPIGYVYSTQAIETLVEKEILIELSVSNDEELKELQESKDENKIMELSKEYGLNADFCKELLSKNKISLRKLRLILEALQVDCMFDGIDNLPFIANRAFGNEYPSSPANDAILIKGYLQSYYFDNDQKVFLNTYDNMINYYKREKQKQIERTNKKRKSSKQSLSAPYIHIPAKVINLYMQFIYSTLEYYIFPVIDIGLDIKQINNIWPFGKNVIESLDMCKNKYYKKTFGNLNIDNLSQSHLKIISTLKDYGLSGSLRKINISILDEIESKLNIRYSTIDVLNAIVYLAENSVSNREFFIEVRNKYIS